MLGFIIFIVVIGILDYILMEKNHKVKENDK